MQTEPQQPNLMTDPKMEPPTIDPSRDNAEAPTSAEKILCPHCLRTASNGIKCQGICVADSNY